MVNLRTGLIGKKIGMSSKFDTQGKRITLTFLHVDNCLVVGQRVMEKNGYDAVVVGSGLQKPKKLSKPMREAFAKAKIEPRARLKEFRVSKEHILDVGTELSADHYKIGQYIDVRGESKGKGFAGAMKRHNFRGLEASHGVSISHRSHGSTGQCQDPGKVFKNKKMAGRLGGQNTTIQNLRIVDIDVQKSLIIVSGNVPGSKGNYVFIKDAIKKADII